MSLQLRLSVRSVCQLSGSISSCLEVKGQTPPLQNPATRLHGPVLIKDLRTSEVFNLFPLLFYLILFTLLYLHFISLTSDYSGLTKFNAKDLKSSGSKCIKPTEPLLSSSDIITNVSNDDVQTREIYKFHQRVSFVAVTSLLDSVGFMLRIN